MKKLIGILAAAAGAAYVWRARRRLERGRQDWAGSTDTVD
ncbi:DLW-39 family protein [Spelaeicoccus albus]|uniref:Uncharacterized protein n=1 Tax=Spelaeicoccus albus TaxID=1280376 RepID=A0A7Z0ABH0_9MICO|nr:DLW-39 family protein [Spelaeicoccus albus]NYI66598.1 hypothetical protein [Spelaeicoccus albus]